MMTSASKSVRVLLAAGVALLAMNLLVNLSGNTVRPAVAAPLPDSAAQLDKVIDELSKLNKNVEKLQAYLESGKLTVKTEKAEK